MKKIILSTMSTVGTSYSTCETLQEYRRLLSDAMNDGTVYSISADNGDHISFWSRNSNGEWDRKS